MAIDVSQLPAEAQRLADLTPVEQRMLTLLGDGLTAGEIAQLLQRSEASVYRAIVDLLDALEFQPPDISAADIHAEAGTRPADPDEISDFHRRFGPFPTDAEG